MRYVRFQDRLLTLALGATVLAAGCQEAKQANREWLFFPSPPERPRVQFLTYANGADEVEPKRGRFADFVLGEEPVVQRAINKPYGLAARDGVVYVCDTKGLALCRLDFKNETYSVIGVTGPGRLKKPINVVIDPLGFKFVADSERKQIVVFSPDDKYVNAFNLPEPCHPVDLAVHQNELYVLDNDETCQVVVLDRSTGQVLRTIGGPGGEPGRFKIPGSLCVDAEGNIYVSDTHNWRIQKLTAQGKPAWAKGEPGYFLGMFGRPRGLRVAPDGIVYVVDGATEIVQMFDQQGRILMRFGSPGSTPGSLGLPSQVAIDATSLPYFQQYLHKDFKAEYLLFVASQYGGHLISVYAFGSFPEGYNLAESDFVKLPPLAVEAGIGPVPESASQPAEATSRMGEPTTQEGVQQPTTQEGGDTREE